jgi:hypothetical protein
VHSQSDLCIALYLDALFQMPQCPIELQSQPPSHHLCMHTLSPDSASGQARLVGALSHSLNHVDKSNTDMSGEFYRVQWHRDMLHHQSQDPLGSMGTVTRDGASYLRRCILPRHTLHRICPCLIHTLVGAIKYS